MLTRHWPKLGHVSARGSSEIRSRAIPVVGDMKIELRGLAKPARKLSADVDTSRDRSSGAAEAGFSMVTGGGEGLREEASRTYIIEEAFVPDLTTPKPGSELVVVVALTKREQDVLQLLASGFSAKEVAKSLAITARTVESHIDRVRLKTRTRNRTHMVAQAIQDGLIARV